MAFSQTLFSQVKPHKKKWDFKRSHQSSYDKKEKKMLVSFFENKIDPACCNTKDIQFYKGNSEYFLSVNMKSQELEIDYFYDHKDVLKFDELLSELAEIY